MKTLLAAMFGIIDDQLAICFHCGGHFGSGVEGIIAQVGHKCDGRVGNVSNCNGNRGDSGAHAVRGDGSE